MASISILKSVVITGLIASVTACGQSSDHKDKRTQETADQTTFNPADPYLVRGRWELPVTSGGQSLRTFHATLGTGSANAPIGATVAAAVKFAISTANFVTPANPADVASYGSLDVTDLKDNTLRVCGPAGDQKCSVGVIRIYTSGTPGPGLWNAIEKYGLPITSGTNNIGLAPAGAFEVKAVKIGALNTLKLSDFTAGAALKIPVAVNFGDAAAGTYASTMVVEYVVQ